MPRTRTSKRFVGTVGVYFLRHGRDEDWETLVHRRSEKVDDFRNQISTPGGSVDKSDCVDEHEKMNKELGFYTAMVREAYEETGINLEGFPAENIWKLGQSTGSTHQHYVIYFNASLAHAKPPSNHEWEMIRGGVDDLGDSVPGGFYAWVGLRKLLLQPDLMDDCRPALEDILRWLKSTSSSSSAVPVSARNGEFLTASSGDSSARDFVRYATSYEPLVLQVPDERMPLDVIRKEMGRLTKVRPWAKRKLTADTRQSNEWHLKNAELMVREHFEARGLGGLLGKAVFGTECGLDYVQFVYLQPKSLNIQTFEYPCGRI